MFHFTLPSRLVSVEKSYVLKVICLVRGASSHKRKIILCKFISFTNRTELFTYYELYYKSKYKTI
jgi:hypothetical protein